MTKQKRELFTIISGNRGSWDISRSENSHCASFPIFFFGGGWTDEITSMWISKSADSVNKSHKAAAWEAGWQPCFERISGWRLKAWLSGPWSSCAPAEASCSLIRGWVFGSLSSLWAVARPSPGLSHRFLMGLSLASSVPDFLKSSALLWRRRQGVVSEHLSTVIFASQTWPGSWLPGSSVKVKSDVTGLE